MPDELLRLDGVSRVFGGIRALDGLDFAVTTGTIVGLIGPNGAGKTTVINLVSGLLRPSAGTIRLAGRAIHRLPAHRIAELGVARTYQNSRLFRASTALENVVIGQHHRRPPMLLASLLGAPSARREQRQAEERARELLADVGLSGNERTLAGGLAYGDQRRLEIARALAAEPRLLLLDEPAAGMPFHEVLRLIELIRALPARGVSVVLVEHNMQLVMNVCDRVTVLNFGRAIANGPPAEIGVDPRVIAAYLGVDAAVSA